MNFSKDCCVYFQELPPMACVCMAPARIVPSIKQQRLLSSIRVGQALELYPKAELPFATRQSL
jgi:hypothetical protein